MLDLSRIDMSEVDPELLAEAVTGVERVNLYGTNHSNPQMDSLFTRILQGSKLKKLLIGDLAMRNVDPVMLAGAINKLEYVNLYLSMLTNEQKKTILTAITVGTKLKSLKMQSSLFFYDDPYLLARAVNMLEEVDLSYAVLNKYELENAIRESLQPYSKLRRFWLKGVGGALAHVDEELLLMAADKIELTSTSVSLHHSSLPDI